VWEESGGVAYKFALVVTVIHLEIMIPACLFCVSVLANLIGTETAVKKWRKPGIHDSSYADELRRQELAEQRRKKQQEMYERLKARKSAMTDNLDDDDGSPKFEDCKFTTMASPFMQLNIYV